MQKQEIASMHLISFSTSTIRPAHLPDFEYIPIALSHSDIQYEANGTVAQIKEAWPDAVILKVEDTREIAASSSFTVRCLGTFASKADAAGKGAWSWLFIWRK